MNNTMIVDFPDVDKILSKSTKVPATKKRVRLSPNSLLYVWEDGSNEDGERALLSYNKYDFEIFTRARNADAARTRRQNDVVCLELVSIAGDSSISTDESFTARGIEHLLHRPTLVRIAQAKTNVRAAVMEEQARQKAAGIYDPIALRKASRTHSTWARRRAVILAGGKVRSNRVATTTPAA